MSVLLEFYFEKFFFRFELKISKSAFKVKWLLCRKTEKVHSTLLLCFIFKENDLKLAVVIIFGTLSEHLV